MPKRTKAPEPTGPELQALRLEERVINFSHGRGGTKLSNLKAKSDMGMQRPIVEGIRDRSIPYEVPSWQQRILPGKDGEDAAKVLDPKAAKSKLKANADYVGTYNQYNGILRPEYDMLEPFVIHDTEAYLRRA